MYALFSIVNGVTAAVGLAEVLAAELPPAAADVVDAAAPLIMVELVADNEVAEV